MANTVLIQATDLLELAQSMFLKVGMNEEDSDFHAQALVNTNLWGIDSHGILRIPAYIKRMLNGAINVTPNIKSQKGAKSFQVIDGDSGAGFIVGKAAMEKAIALAEENGIGAVGVMNSNHFGAGAIYSRLATEKGMVGICMTNVLPLIVAPGASKPVVGNNPIAIAIPTYGNFPFVLDMSLSKVAGGKLTLAIKKKEKIPMDWATDKAGRPTDDPQEAFNGYLLPMGDYKGLGLAYAVDILCGVITGGVFSSQMKSMYANPNDPSLTGHFMIAINLKDVITKEALQERMSLYYNSLKQTPMWQENAEMYLPGELEYIKSEERKVTGIPVPLTTYEELIQLANELEVADTIVNKIKSYRKE